MIMSRNITFQLTHLLRGATHIVFIGANCAFISTHAPLARCDTVRCIWADNANFNSRTSCEVRHFSQRSKISPISISTHAPLARCDFNNGFMDIGNYDFNSRTSCEVRRGSRLTMFLLAHFNSRTSCEVRLGFVA